MDFTIPKTELNRALQVTQSAVGKKTTMPILNNLLLSASGSELRISASDLEITSIVSVKAKVRSGGSTTVNAKVFSDVVKELPDGDINIGLTEGERIEVTTKGSVIKLVGISAEEYPALPGTSLKVKGKIAANVLLEMISKTLYSASTDETRYTLNGVCFSLVDGVGEATAKKSKGKNRHLRLVATDGHRLALINRPAGEIDFDGDVIVPRRGLAEVRRVLDAEGDKEVGIDIVEGFLLVETAHSKVVMRLIDGQYPDYSQVVPKDKGSVVDLKAGDLVQALRRVILMVSDREKGVRMNFAPSLLRISSSSPEVGEASEELPIEYKGEVLTIGFNAAYMLDALSSFGDVDEIALELYGKLGPAKIYPKEDEGSLGIVMPMRL